MSTIFNNSIALKDSWSDYDDLRAYLKYAYGCLIYHYTYIWGPDVHYGGSSNKEETIIKINRKNTKKYIELIGDNFLTNSEEKFCGYDVNEKFRQFLDDNHIGYRIEEKKRLNNVQIY